MVNYTTGNWTVTGEVTDSTLTKLAIELPQLDKNQYAITADEPGDARYNNVTGTGLASPEALRFGSSDVSNVYNTDTTPTSAQMPGKTGKQVLVELTTHYHATNKVSGAEYDIPLKTWLVVKCPTAELVQADIVNDACRKLMGVCFGNSNEGISKITEMIRGELRID